MINITDKTPIDINDLTSHLACFGRSGAGKSGQLISIAEQVLAQGVPVVVVDIKSDLANMLQQSGSLKDKINPILLTPGARHGDPVDLFSNFANNIDGTATYLLKLIGMESSRTQEAYHSFLSTVLRSYKGTSLNLEKLLPMLANPGFDKLGMLDLDEVVPVSQRRTLIIKLNNLIANESFKIWREGVSLNFDYLLKKGAKTPLVVFSVAHLANDEERTMALTFFLSEFLSWTLKQSGTKTLRTLLVMDEVQNLFPPAPKNPVTKPPIMSLLKQARAFGIGIMIGTQSVKAIDYQALGQCNTWVVGQLKTKHDRDRILEGLSHIEIPAKHLDAKIAGLSAREFLVSSGPTFGIGRSMQCEAKLTGPMTSPEVESLYKQGLVVHIHKQPTAVADKTSAVWNYFFKGK